MTGTSSSAPPPISHCRSCGAEVVWCVTAADKNMPMDAAPVEDGTFHIFLEQSGTIRAHHTKDGLMLVMMDGTFQIAPRFTSHFATCPNAAEHRKNTTQRIRKPKTEST
jgi:hypothetical protein